MLQDDILSTSQSVHIHEPEFDLIASLVYKLLLSYTLTPLTTFFAK